MNVDEVDTRPVLRMIPDFVMITAAGNDGRRSHDDCFGG